MDAHGRMPSSYGRRPIQAPGMMRHGPLPGPGPADHHPREALLPPEHLEKKVAIQEAEMERIARENQRFAESNVAMRQELVATQKEMQRVQAYLGSIHTESDIQIRGLLEKIGKLEDDIHSGDVVKKELQQAHLEAQNLITVRQELSAEIQVVTEELQKSTAGFKKLPEMHSELDGLRQEHQTLRATFEYEKGLNIEQVERMRAMEKNLMSMAKEVERLRAEVTGTEQIINAPNQYGGMHQTAGQGTGYPNHSFSMGGGGYMAGSHVPIVNYADAGFGYANPAHYTEAHGRPQAHMTSGASAEGIDSYGGMSTASGTNIYGGSQAR
ncbi:unnamed protein product [Musa acuminata subsp. malaccensis]|uniref:(wild Malaysian banana) hypothetical protein n=1 Tax=Musa acuminata subsp. malaccensis TaxID=214687 RepID=A0A8D7AFI2_MUSAM|nr:unnamed protein product [Musa acuminata subsp. malaccensis]